LIAKRDTYALDLGGLSPEEFTEELRHQGFDTPQVDLVLKFTNTGDKPIKIERRWGLNQPTVHLVGPGAINLPDVPRQTGLETGGAEEPLKPLELAAGASHSLPVTQLKGADGVYWVLPGDYRVHATWSAKVSPAPKGAGDAEDGFGFVWIRCAPVKLKVLPAMGPYPDPLEKSEEAMPLGALVPPPEDQKTSILRQKLDLKVTLDKGLRAGTKLAEALDFLEDRYDFTIRIDEPAFQKAGKEKVGATKVELRKLSGVSLRAVLYMILDQLEASFEIRDGAVRIFPVDKPASLAERLRPASQQVRKAIRRNLSAEVPIGDAKAFGDDTTLAEAIEYLEDKFDLTILIDNRAFIRAKIAEIEKQTVKPAAQEKVPAGKFLEDLLKPAGATFILREDFILVVPRE